MTESPPSPPPVERFRSTSPYGVILYVGWTLFFVACYLNGIPLGSGSPVHT